MPLAITEAEGIQQVLAGELEAEISLKNSLKLYI
jgi:hypothetical protein